jgi:hypothetical protein
METHTDHIGAESPNEKDQEKDQEPSQQQQEEERFQLLVADLFDSYHPGSPLEDAAVITLADALWKRKDHRGDTSATRDLDQQIDTALAQLSKSQAVRRDQELSRQGTGSMSSIRRKNPDWGLVRRSVGPPMRARPRCSREALQLWAPHGVGNNSSNAKTAAPSEDPLAAPLLAWSRGESV